MPATDERPRDLAALRIRRDEERHDRGLPLGKVAIWTVLVAVLVAIAWFAYAKWVVPGRAPLVETQTVKATVNVANPALLTATGYLVADRQAKITPKISGKVVTLNVDTGMDVRRGDVLAVLESTNLQAQLDEANAGLNQAQREYTRQSALWREGVTTKALLDAAQAALETARARVAQVQINKGDMVIRAPFDGTVATKNTEVGEVISSATLGQVAGTLPTGAICTLVDLKTLKVVADVNEGSIGQLHEGQPAEVSVDAFPGKKWKGQLTQIIPTADRAKAVVQVKVAILNPTERLLPEMSASVSFLQTARSDAELQEAPKIWLPSSAIVDGNVATVGAGKRIVIRKVTTGAVREGRIEVTSGLHEGERIVSENRESLKNGQLVRLPDA
ncbi:MAG: efflux RND transporter periplasmic adaptor subunit [Acidobacteriota bacterium]